MSQTSETSLQWNRQQNDALTMAARWLADPSAPQVLRLFGYAGTGKTTLARHLAEGVSGSVLYGAFTGKAAAVLRERGCDGATTLHSMLYHVSTPSHTKLIELETQLEEMAPNHPDYAEIKALTEEERRRVKRPVFMLNPDSVIASSALLILDECSMVDRKLGEDVLSFGKKVLVLGDPAQLPPVAGGGFFTNVRPDILLTEIHRQAADNPIIRWATAVRNGEVLPYKDEGLAKKLKRDRLPEGWFAKHAGQILCGKNETRTTMNAAVRKALGFTDPFPMKGERLVCLQNDHKLGLLNGEIWHACRNVTVDDEWPTTVTAWIKSDEERPKTIQVEMDRAPFLGKEPERVRGIQSFDYGYCLTVHKSQGSQWDTVTLFDDGFAKRDPSARQRWLYTAITRAQKQLYIVTS